MHSREILSSLMWYDYPSERAKKYLRQTLWQLKSALDAHAQGGPTLLIDGEWIGIDPDAVLGVDVEAFELAFHQIELCPGDQLDDHDAAILRAAADSYRGGLLEGWYQEWCLAERERFQTMHLMMLDRLIDYSLEQQDYMAGIMYGERILRCDRAHERTHQRLMLLHSRVGDRTAAIRQYQRCVAALEEELSVKPARATVELYQRIAADELEFRSLSISSVLRSPGMLDHLAELQVKLADIQSHIQQMMRGEAYS